MADNGKNTGQTRNGTNRKDTIEMSPGALPVRIHAD